MLESCAFVADLTVAELVEIDARKACLDAGVVLDADGICAGHSVAASIVPGLRRRLVRTVVVTVHVIVVATTGGRDRELGTR